MGPLATPGGGATIEDDSPATSKSARQASGTMVDVDGAKTSPWSSIALASGDGGISTITGASEGGARGIPSFSLAPLGGLKDVGPMAGARMFWALPSLGQARGSS